ncbi:Replication protein A 32 kDa subunit B [Citrus sinensis]|uniref:Replication protein A 32 kDa subunit B n=1 Tax=Citrus sinensis TaxID=2711 RepID=A0ACB8P7B2_CITSI|nr:Replication protein A 32 kDa subunit B [Citrus sinensis]
MYSGEFDGAAAFSGGGFMPSQATTVPDPSSSFSKNRNVRTLLPMTVKQLSELSSNDESSASIDGADVNTITVVGIVCDMQDKEPQFIFLIDDGTGRIECSRWAHEQMEFNEVNQISKGMYVRVYGHLKAFQDKRSLNAYSLRPIIDFNEITSHFVECIYVQLYNTRLRYSFDEGKSIDQMVLNFLRRPEFLANNNGVHRNVISQQLNLPMDKLMEALESLNENSLVYSIDEFHYKSAVNA